MAREQFQFRLTDTDKIVQARNARLAKANQPKKVKAERFTSEAVQNAVDALIRCGATVSAKPYRRGS